MMYDQELAVADEVEMHTMNTGHSMTSIILRSLHYLPVQKLPMTILMQIRTSPRRELRRRRSPLFLVGVHLNGTNLHEIGQSNRSHSYGDRGPGRGGGQRQHRPSESPKVFLPILKQLNKWATPGTISNRTIPSIPLGLTTPTNRCRGQSPCITHIQLMYNHINL